MAEKENLVDLLQYIKDKKFNLNVDTDLEVKLMLDITGENLFRLYGMVKNRKVFIVEESFETPDITVTSSDKTALGIFQKKINPMMAFLTGKIKINGKKEAISILKGLVFKK